MMEPVVRLMVPCEDARIRKGTRNKVDILGVITTIGAPANAFPARVSFSAYLCFTDGHGPGSGKITIADDETDEIVFDGEPRPVDFGNAPTAFFGSTITIPMCQFPNPGLYRIDFVYNEISIKSCFVLLRETP